ncbi:hypothetical protein H4R18_005953 [Coemansia javaensis]|uniref:Uncharacterized protein n=1 Tax=Coemansia javaensis TaxID=2761396 RepID=A0A9W8H3T3_9FUNG|nr:hypothetical protein H4R18_005953 [Coemansia javaensis]
MHPPAALSALLCLALSAHAAPLDKRQAQNGGGVFGPLTNTTSIVVIIGMVVVYLLSVWVSWRLGRRQPVFCCSSSSE